MPWDWLSLCTEWFLSSQAVLTLPGKPLTGKAPGTLSLHPPSDPALQALARTHLGRHDLDEFIQEAELAHLVMKPLAAALHACFQNLGREE